MFKRPRGWERKRLAVIAMAGGICYICEQPGADSVDHVRPRAKGVDHSFGNLRAAHRRCNSSKGDRQLLPRAKIAERWL